MTVAIAIILAWFFGINFYVALTHVNQVRKRQELTLFWKCHIYPFVPVFYAFDAVANVIVGFVHFREAPRWGEWLLSARIQRHYDDKASPRHAAAVWWARNLNIFDPEHIKE